MKAAEIKKIFSQWNPMERDYKNTDFNQYISGPGAELDAELQPAQQALKSEVNKSKGKEEQHVPSLIFKHAPENMTRKAIFNMCSQYGRVTAVRDSTKNDFFFADMATVADMEAVLRAMEKNDYGMQVMVSTNQKKKPSGIENPRDNQNFSVAPRSNPEIDYQSRCYRTSSKNPPRPKLKEIATLNAENTIICGLPVHLLADDAHSLERQGLYKMENNNKFTYRNGRSFVNMPENIKQLIERKHNESAGTHIESEDKYVHEPRKDTILVGIGKCSQCYYSCDTVCGRCSSQYYCSVTCQVNDWPEHRYICGKPKHLQKIPPGKKTTETGNKSSKIPKENTKKQTTSSTESRKHADISPKQLPKSSNIFHEVSNSSKPSPKRLPQQNSPSLNSSLQSPSNSLKPSSEKIPVVLKSAFKQLCNSPKESAKELTMTEKSFSQHHSDSSVVSANNTRKPLQHCHDIYKQNMPRSGNIVTITAISKTNVVFIRSTTYGDNLSYFNTVDTLQSLRKMLKPLKTLPKSGDVVIAKFEEQFNRALILSVGSPTNIVINFMDYGNMEKAKMEDLYEAPKEFLFKPRHAIPVLLKDVTDFYMTQEVRKFMHSYLNNINVQIRYKPEDFREGNNVYAVELIDENTQQNFNKMIMQLSKPVEPQSTDEICDYDYLEKVKLPSGTNVELMVMDNSLMNSGCISCTIKPYAIEIEKFQKEIQAYAESIPTQAYTPRVEELCIARYNQDGLWYRGVCLETVGDGYPSIHFIDFGNISLVPIENIRRYPRQFTFPVYTSDCAIEGLPENCNDKIVAKLEDLIPNGKIIKCESVTVDEETIFGSLSLPNIISELNKCGLI